MQGRLDERLSERERIARELHDTLLQGFQGLMLQFQTALDDPDPTRSQHKMELAMDRADEVLLEGRQRVTALRTESLRVHELSEALAAHGEELTRQHLIAFQVTLIGSPVPLDLLVRDEVFRIGREALVNAFRHSGATQIEAEVSYDHAAVRLRIRDNGRGIDQDVLTLGTSRSLGLVRYARTGRDHRRGNEHLEQTRRRNRNRPGNLREDYFPEGSHQPSLKAPMDEKNNQVRR